MLETPATLHDGSLQHPHVSPPSHIPCLHITLAGVFDSQLERAIPAALIYEIDIYPNKLKLLWLKRSCRVYTPTYTSEKWKVIKSNLRQNVSFYSASDCCQNNGNLIHLLLDWIVLTLSSCLELYVPQPRTVASSLSLS